MGFYRLQVGISKKRISCCYHCEDRTAECHSTCERYKKEKAERAEEYEKFLVEARKDRAQTKMEVDRAYNKKKHFNKKCVKRR